MKKEMSIYLDFIRFSAAMVVFLGHVSGPLTGGFLWHFGPYLSAAVMVFFILSGYVIAYVYDTKEKTIGEYTVARISRLSSIVIPALILTFVSDHIGMSINPGLYLDGPWPQPEIKIINYILSFFMLQNIWALDLNPGINTPFWSLSFELMFYALFAVIFYLKGKTRIVAFTLCILLSGPDILLYFPVWLMGAGVYYANKSKSSIYEKNPTFSAVLSLFLLLLFISITPWLNKNISFNFNPLISSRNLILDYIFGIIFSIHLLFVPPLLRKLKWILLKTSKPIVYCASLTFSLYLFHRPLIQLFATISEEATSLQNRFLVIGGTLFIVWIFGRWCENLKYPIKKNIQKYIYRLSSK